MSWPLPWPVADVIVTFNTRDFPPQALSPFGIEAITPDAFAIRLLPSGIVLTAAAEHRAALKQPPLSGTEYLDALRRNGLPQSANALPADQL